MMLSFLFEKNKYICYDIVITIMKGVYDISIYHSKNRIMNIHNPQFEISAVGPKQYPKNHLPEIVLVGKSNVGKSSFINTMINRKKLARTSSEPRKNTSN